MTKIAIIGAGIVGASAAYFLKEKGYQEVVLFDKEEGQASKAAAGIICPWFSKRRHKAWYKMARLGADFYQELVEKLAKDGYETSFYQQTGVYLLKNKEKQLEALYDLANERRAISPLIGDLRLLSKEEVASAFPGLQGFDNCLWASGAAHVDGKRLCQTLISASGYPIYRKSVNLLPLEKGYQIDGDYFDVVILAAGAWLPQLLSPLGYEVDVRPQKGQLIDYQMEALQTDDYAVVMPEGELDIIPFDKGRFQ